MLYVYVYTYVYCTFEGTKVLSYTRRYNYTYFRIFVLSYMFMISYHTYSMYYNYYLISYDVLRLLTS